MVTISQAYNTTTSQLDVHNLWKDAALFSIYFPSKETYAKDLSGQVMGRTNTAVQFIVK